MSPSTRNASFSLLDDIVIKRADAGGFVILLGPNDPGVHRRLYAALSTAEETAGLLKEMLSDFPAS